MRLDNFQANLFNQFSFHCALLSKQKSESRVILLFQRLQFTNKCLFHSLGSFFNNSSSPLCVFILKVKNSLIASILGSRLRRRRLLNLVQLLHRRRAVKLKVVLLSSLLLLSSDENETRVRSCRRDTRNDGWFVKVWTEYSDKRFKESLPVPRHCQQHLTFILTSLRNVIALLNI